MAGVTDQPFRTLCRRLGAGLVVSEMVTSDTRLWKTNKSKWRLNHEGEADPISVQIAGAEPEMMAQAARDNVKLGAQIIDINMGCPAKKVCNRAAGSALLQDEPLVAEILAAVVGAVSVPVTLKIRTGWDHDHRNAVRIAKLAEATGIQLLSVHGRTRADRFLGDAEYDTIAEVKSAVAIPVLANGDIDTPEKAQHVLQHTGADGVMIGRAAQGNPWLFREINHFLSTGQRGGAATVAEVKETLLEHVKHVHQFYGEYMGVRIARKHVGWYLSAQGLQKTDYQHIHRLDDAEAQLSALHHLIEERITIKETAA